MKHDELQGYEQLKTDASSMRFILEETTPDRDLWSEQEFGAILKHQMDTPLHSGLAEHTAAGPTYTFGDLLRDTRPDAEILRAVKDFAKNLRGDTTSGFPAPVATALYYAAIVAAEQRAGTRISELDDARLREGCVWALAQPWLTDDLRRLFSACKS